jgi:hypothetical protein
MTRSISLIFCAMLGTGILACGSNDTSTKESVDVAPKDPLDIVPTDNTVSGWTVDQNKNPGGKAKTATSLNGVENLIDGGSENYFQGSNLPKMFFWQNYVNSTLPSAPEGATVKLYIFELPSADQAKGIYTAILKRPSYTGEWEPSTPTVGTESRIQNTSSQWWINFNQGVFYVEVLLAPSYGPPPDYLPPSNADTKQETVRFAQAIASKI